MWFAETHGIFVKSLPDHGWLNGQDAAGNLIVKQSAEDIFQSMTLQPNTKSFGLPERISFSFLVQQSVAPGFRESYRNNGILFTYRDGDKQDYFLPCDMLALTQCMNLPTTKSEVLYNIQEYYKYKVLNNRKLFAAEDIDTALMRIHHFHLLSWLQLSQDELVIAFVNSFRESCGHSLLSSEHDWLTSYNECIKFDPLKVNIIWAFGTSKNLINQAKLHNVPLYEWVDHFLKSRES
jgi:hypothetical protein